MIWIVILLATLLAVVRLIAKWSLNKKMKIVSCNIKYRQCDTAVFLPHNIVTEKQEHSDSTNLCQCHTLKRKWPRIRIQIFRLIRIQLRMSVGSVPKCWGCKILSASVVSLSMVQVGRWLYEKCQQMSKNPLFCNDEEKWSGIHMQIWITTKSQSLLEGHLLHACLPSLVDGRFRVRSYPVYRMTERMKEWQRTIT